MKSLLFWFFALITSWGTTATADISVTFIFDQNQPLSEAVSKRLGELPANSHVQMVNTYGIQDCNQLPFAVEDSLSRGASGVILLSSCRDFIDPAAQKTSEAGIPLVTAGWEDVIAAASGSSTLYGFSFPKLNTGQLTDQMKELDAGFFGWCADIDLSMISSDAASTPLGTCLGITSSPDGLKTRDAVMIAAIDLMVQLINGSTVATLPSAFGDLSFDPNTRSFRIPGQVVLYVDSTDFQTYEQQQWPLNAPEDILGKFCPNCSGSGQICARGDICPKECGKNNCTKSGNNTCCNSAGMPAPDY